MVYETGSTKTIERIFDGWEESLIWSALQGVMGKIYVTDKEKPLSAMIFLGDFCYFAGEPDKELAGYKPDWFSEDFVIMVPQNDGWAGIIEEVYGEKSKRVTRYAIKKEKDVFDRKSLWAIVDDLPSGYEVKLIDEDIYRQCGRESWARDLVARYKSYEDYKRLGLGAAVLKEGTIVSGASSYSSYQGGIEIEIDTREDCRRKGLASVCGARLVLECLNRGMYPSWDAQNLWSVGLAEKLGYHFSHEYDAYEIRGY